MEKSIEETRPDVVSLGIGFLERSSILMEQIEKGKLAIVMPNYNDSQHLIKWVDRIFSQPPCDLPTEVIIDDDKSTDRSVALIKGLQKFYPIIKLKLVL